MSFAVVVSDIAPLYTKPEPLCELADEALYGMVLEVLAREGMYCRVRTHYRYEGWTPARSPARASPPSGPPRRLSWPSAGSSPTSCPASSGPKRWRTCSSRRA